MPVLGGYSILVNWTAANSLGSFSRVSGIRAENAVLDSTSSLVGGGTVVQKIAGKYNCSPTGVTLMAGFMEELVSGQWWKAVQNIQRGDVSSVRGPVDIVIRGSAGVPALTVTLENAWPSKWSGSDLSIQRSVVWVETVVFQCEHIKFTWDAGQG